MMALDRAYTSVRTKEVQVALSPSTVNIFITRPAQDVSAVKSEIFAQRGRAAKASSPSSFSAGHFNRMCFAMVLRKMVGFPL
jgi:hypothetical protein